jgi:hypothetical protein
MEFLGVVEYILLPKGKPGILGIRNCIRTTKNIFFLFKIIGEKISGMGFGVWFLGGFLGVVEYILFYCENITLIIFV